MKKLAATITMVLFVVSVAHARGRKPQQVSVEQLRALLSELDGQSDKKIAKKIASVELTQRLSRYEYEKLEGKLPGQRSKAELLGVADASAFLAPPASAVLPDPAPNAKGQREMLQRAANFAADQSDALPAFEVVRTTGHFQDVRVYPFSNLIEYYTPGNLRLVDRSVDDILCAPYGEQRREIPDQDLDKSFVRQPHPLMGMTGSGFGTIWGDVVSLIPNASPTGLKPTGAFGPWLEAVTGDVPEGEAQWGYLERAGSRRLAVFRFRIPQGKSHYTITYRFIPDLKNPYKIDPGREYTADPGYHGEIAMDPATGKIARILVICDFARSDPMLKAAMELEYGPVKIGGDDFVLPLRGVSSSSVVVTSNRYSHEAGDMDIEVQTDHWVVSTVDDLSFSEYGVYRPRIRIVPLESLPRPKS